MVTWSINILLKVILMIYGCELLMDVIEQKYIWMIKRLLLNIKKKFPDALLVFIVPPTAEDLKKRLTGRGTESAEVIEKRLRRAAEESDGMDSYDYIVVNDDVDTCVEDLHSLIRSSHFKESANTDLVARMKQELHDMTK